jgi:hypothetical protein
MRQFGFTFPDSGVLRPLAKDMIHLNGSMSDLA